VTCGLLALAGDGGAQDDVRVALKGAGGDPMELGRVVRAYGDDAVREALGSPEGIRATPWLDAPEEVLPALAEIAAGDDPLLAPLATRAAHRIAERLDPVELHRREVYGAIDAAGFTAIAEDETARADLRRLAGVTAELLDGLDRPVAAETE